MKRGPSKCDETLGLRQKFQNLDFHTGIDRFNYFFTPATYDPKKKLTFRLEPFLEASATGCDEFYSTTLHKRMAGIEETPILNVMSNYVDFLLLNSNKDFETKNFIYSHVMNHVYKYKTMVKDNTEANPTVKDQAFTSAIAVILVPTLGHAKHCIEFMVNQHCKGNWKKVSKFSMKKYKEIFEDEPELDSDAVKLGITLGDKDMHLFSNFKKCDIILATPMSLKQGLEKSENQNDTGILCSIQISVVLDCHMLLMQNWDHIEDIFKNMNLIPDRDSMTTDLNRIRDEYLDGKSHNFRQLIVQTEFLSPIIMSLFNRNPNFRGKAKTIEHYTATTFPCLQKFRKFQASSTSEINEKRYEYFCQFWLRIKEEIPTKSIIFVQSYFEYVRLKSFLEENDPGISCLCEYTSKPERQRSIAQWSQNTSKALCITERLSYFRPLKLRQVSNIFFYSLPEFKANYESLVRASEESTSIFCKYDAFALQRIVGDVKAEKMISSNSEIFSIN